MYINKLNLSFQRIFCISIFIFIQLQAISQNGNGSVKGRIIDSKNNEPVPYATINVYGTSIGVLSDSSGRFTISNLTPGYIQLKITSVGYKTNLTDNIFVTNSHAVETEIVMEEDALQLQEVVVKGQSILRNDDSPVSLRALSTAEIEKSPGSNRDISKVVQILPGVASTPAYRNDIIVRGGGTSENRFFLDGVEIPTINHFSTQGASGGPVGIINLDFIKDVNFYSSAFPADRGDALSSVIEFKQIDGNKDKIRFKGDIGATDVGISLDGPLSKNSTFLISARRSYLQFLFQALDLPFLPTYNDMQAKIKIHINEKNTLEFIGLGAYDISSLNLQANQTEDKRYILGYLPVIEEYSYTIGAVYRHYGEKSNQNLVISRNYLFNYYYKYWDNNPDSTKILDYRSFEADNRFRFENNINFDNGIKLNMGINYDVAQFHQFHSWNSSQLWFCVRLNFSKVWSFYAR